MSAIYSFFQSMPWEIFHYRFMVNALVALVLITPLLALMGTMAVNNRMAYFSDALGHCALTGIALGVLLGMEDYLLAMVGFGILMALVVSWVKSAGTASADTIISVFSSIALALGLAILSRGGGFAKYSAYLVGDILAITPQGIGILGITFIAVLVIWVLLFNRLALTSVNAPLALSRGVHTRWVEIAFVLAVAVVVMLAIRWVGILMINALLILPAAAARNIARSARQYTALAVAFSLGSGIAGLFASYALDISAAACIVLLLGTVFLVTFLFKGVRHG